MNNIIKIKLTSVNDVKDFVNAATQYAGSVKVHSGDYIVSGKSLLGMFSLDLTHPIRIEYDGKSPSAELDTVLNRFRV